MTDDELIAAARDRLSSDAPPPAGADELAEAETQLGFSLPCHWGCAIWSCVDCNSEAGRVIRFDPKDSAGPGCPSWSGAWTEERATLADRLADWLHDELPFRPDSPQPPCPTPTGFSGSWRV